MAMIGAEERRRLISRLGGDPVSPLGAVLKCAACILLLVLIAAGPWAFLSQGGPRAAKEPAAPKADAARADDKNPQADKAVRGSSVAEASDRQ
jgi:hypothetical protein